MEHFSSDFVCEPIMWVGGEVIPHDEQHAFRYEVRDKRGNVLGFINTDRARQHPDVKWELSLLSDGKIEELDGKYGTVQEALAAFLRFNPMSIYFTINTAMNQTRTTIFDADGLERARSYKQSLIRDGKYRADQITISGMDSNGKVFTE